MTVSSCDVLKKLKMYSPCPRGEGGCSVGVVAKSSCREIELGLPGGEVGGLSDEFHFSTGVVSGPIRLAMS